MSKLSQLVDSIKEYKFKSSKGLPLEKCVEYQLILRLCSEAYLHGAINGIKRFARWRKGVRVVLPFEKPLEEVIKEYEERFGIKYKGHRELDKLKPLNVKDIKHEKT